MEWKSNDACGLQLQSASLPYLWYLNWPTADSLRGKCVVYIFTNRKYHRIVHLIGLGIGRIFNIVGQDINLKSTVWDNIVNEAILVGFPLTSVAFTSYEALYSRDFFRDNLYKCIFLLFHFCNHNHFLP